MIPSSLYIEPKNLLKTSKSVRTAVTVTVLTDNTMSIDCEFEENGALPACGYKTAPNSKLNWTVQSHGEIAMSSPTFSIFLI